MTRKHRIRLVVSALIVLAAIAIPLSRQPLPDALTPAPTPSESNAQTISTLKMLNQLAVKGRAPKTGYARTQFGNGWQETNSCDTRNIILARDMTDTHIDKECHVVSGTLNDPYTGKTIHFRRGSSTSQDVQIDHVVALSDAWQTGAQALTFAKREALANDPLELLAVDGPANQQKGDGDAATWLPPNKPFRCQYVSRQVKVKAKYHLWVTAAEKSAIERILARC